MGKQTIKFPSFYDPQRVGELYLPRVDEAVEAGLKAGLAAAANDILKVLLILVDPQIAFIFLNAALAVPGAIADTQRIIEWIFRNVGVLTHITASMDTHLIYQIFYRLWFVAAKDFFDPTAGPKGHQYKMGDHPLIFTMIKSADIGTLWLPVVANEIQGTGDYLRALDAGGRYTHTIWPFHTMLGSVDHAIVPALFEAIMFHAAGRHEQPTFLTKGSIPNREHYSIVKPEVPAPKFPGGGISTGFLDALTKYDLIYVAGQAKSHCVLWTMRDILAYFHDRPEVIAKLRFLMDCTSSVQHPAVDFDGLANAELAEMKKQGMRLVTSMDPIG